MKETEKEFIKDRLTTCSFGWNDLKEELILNYGPSKSFDLLGTILTGIKISKEDSQKPEYYWTREKQKSGLTSIDCDFNDADKVKQVCKKIGLSPVAFGNLYRKLIDALKEIYAENKAYADKVQSEENEWDSVLKSISHILED